jgi:hypothetical protein
MPILAGDFFSLINISLPWQAPLPIPEAGGFDDADLIHLLHLYTGFYNAPPTNDYGGLPVIVSSRSAAVAPVFYPLANRVIIASARDSYFVPVTIPLATTNIVVRVPPPQRVAAPSAGSTPG